jgi:hypothetical protein
MGSQNSRTASRHPRSGSLAYLDQGLGIPLRLATSTKRRIVRSTLPERVPARTPVKMVVSVSETLFLVPSFFRERAVTEAPCCD